MSALWAFWRWPIPPFARKEKCSWAESDPPPTGPVRQSVGGRAAGLNDEVWLECACMCGRMYSLKEGPRSTSQLGQWYTSMSTAWCSSTCTQLEKGQETVKRFHWQLVIWVHDTQKPSSLNERRRKPAQQNYNMTTSWFPPSGHLWYSSKKKSHGLERSFSHRLGNKKKTWKLHSDLRGY